MDIVFIYYKNMHKTVLKNSLIIIIFVILLIMQFDINFSRAIKTESDKYETLVTLKILEDAGNMDSKVTRAEFAKFLVKCSKYREKVPEFINEDVCNDVKFSTPYAPYIKKVLEEGYMFTYLGGYFKPGEYVTYSDLSRACLALLSYNNEDFRGNQIIGRNLKFKSLNLNDNIEKNDLDILEKKDIAIGLYNTLKEKEKNSDQIYGKIVFPDLIIDADNELNASEYYKKNITGPIFYKRNDNIDLTNDKFDNVYINGVKYSIDDLKNDIINFGYAICYFDIDNKTLYAYTERQDVSAPIILRKGYVYKIYYLATNMIVPYRVDIDKYKYFLDSEEVKYAFSVNGSIKENDYIVYICNKMNELSTSYIDDNGKVVHNDDEAEPYNGSIITAFDISLILQDERGK